VKRELDSSSLRHPSPQVGKRKVDPIRGGDLVESRGGEKDRCGLGNFGRGNGEAGVAGIVADKMQQKQDETALFEGRNRIATGGIEEARKGFGDISHLGQGYAYTKEGGGTNERPPYAGESRSKGTRRDRRALTNLRIEYVITRS